MTPRRVHARHERWPLTSEFRIARGAKTHADVVVVTLEQDGAVGRGECTPYARYGETVASVLEQIEGARALLDAPAHAGFEAAQAALLDGVPAGAARNALDCALWDLACKQRGVRASALRGLPPPAPRLTAYTLSIDTPDAMAAAAGIAPEPPAAIADAANATPLLKMKLAGDGADLARIEAVHAAAPRARLILDANEGLDRAGLEALAPVAARCGAVLIEQPLPAAEDAALAGFDSPVPLCADESLHTSADLDVVAQRYQAVNVKLDKTGGFDEAARTVEQARALGLHVMVGCMVATSLAMAPAFLLTPLADYVDLDGPLLLAQDRTPAIAYDGALMPPPPAAVWG